MEALLIIVGGVAVILLLLFLGALLQEAARLWRLWILLGCVALIPIGMVTWFGNKAKGNLLVILGFVAGGIVLYVIATGPGIVGRGRK